MSLTSFTFPHFFSFSPPVFFMFLLVFFSFAQILLGRFYVESIIFWSTQKSDSSENVTFKFNYLFARSDCTVSDSFTFYSHIERWAFIWNQGYLIWLYTDDDNDNTNDDLRQLIAYRVPPFSSQIFPDFSSIFAIFPDFFLLSS